MGFFVPAGIFCLWFDTTYDSSIWRGRTPTPFTIVKRENVSSTAFILTVRPQVSQHHLRDNDPYSEFWNFGTWAVKIVQPELQISRYYTPLPPLDTDRSEKLRFLIRKIEDGEVSVYLDRLSVGGKVKLYEPTGTAGLNSSDDVTDVVFLAGGTGIAPAMGFAYSLLERKHANEGPRIHILWANRRREDCLGGDSHSGTTPREGIRRNRLVKELDDLQQKHPDRLFVDYFVDEEGTTIDANRIWQATKTTSAQSGTPTKMLLVSGPEGFVDYFAGMKKWEDGEHKQGDVGGLLGRMRLEGWKVLKL
ncbi:uncharacterized protein LY89DRAFT_654124 [Mollisia scopiformis]|uniref:FAD-binding FR-type domain-containing protein n=1 Tax=Mollisia scopiformis TaxID=149040 RepID=A0A194WV85_MOLSC|nr:uncharacterized protein LY89DRAFT_654124 [Mollisia scopiformis]KUJ11502.1 hypothetical protein LY89DRAFT_654124 [Mollisia scopiformis]